MYGVQKWSIFNFRDGAKKKINKINEHTHTKKGMRSGKLVSNT